MNTNPFHRRMAKRLDWLSDRLAFIRTPTRTYEWNEDLDEPRFTFAGWVVLPQLSIWLMDKSYDLDPQHWDHWAMHDKDCFAKPCAVCNGCLCDDDRFPDRH